jgi:hypothetical protein
MTNCLPVKYLLANCKPLITISQNLKLFFNSKFDTMNHEAKVIGLNVVTHGAELCSMAAT